jgi:hypothetical protein
MATIVHAVLFCIVLLPLCSGSRAETYHVDPGKGSPANDGSPAKPWRTLQEVVESGLVETRTWDTLPYHPGASLAVRNPGAPVGAGDTLLLFDGYHGKVVIRSAYNRRPITIMSAKDHTPRLGRLHVVAAARWILKGLSISPRHAPDYVREGIVQVTSHSWRGPVREIRMENCEVFSVADISQWSAHEWNELSCNGIEIDGNAITILDNRITNVNFGIVIVGDSSLIDGNTIENFAGDGLRGLGNDLVFQYNTVKNCYDVNDNHDDGFQSWSRGGDGAVGRGTVYRITLRGNTIINYENPNQPLRGTLQGIGCFDGMFEGWLVENNLIITDHWHGISIYGARNCRVVNNTVCDPNRIKPGPPWIKIRAHKNGTPASGCVVRNNLTGALHVDTAAGRVDHNLVLDEVDRHFVAPGKGDYRLRRNSEAVDAGNEELAPRMDIRGVRRPRGAGFDLGAYERVDPNNGRRERRTHDCCGRLTGQGEGDEACPSKETRPR